MAQRLYPLDIDAFLLNILKNHQLLKPHSKKITIFADLQQRRVATTTGLTGFDSV